MAVALACCLIVALWGWGVRDMRNRAKKDAAK